MPSTVSVNKKTVVTKKSEGKGLAFPDTCLTPAGPSMVPTPYNNIAESKTLTKGSVSVKADGLPMAVKGSYFAMSTGDEAGVGGNVTTGVIKGKAEFTQYSMDVKVEGKGVVRQMDSMVQNCGSGGTPPGPLNQPPGAEAEKEKKGKETKIKPPKVRLLDAGGKPVPNEPYALLYPSGKKVEGKTDKRGKVKIENTKEEGTFKIRFNNRFVDDINPG